MDRAEPAMPARAGLLRFTMHRWCMVDEGGGRWEEDVAVGDDLSPCAT